MWKKVRNRTLVLSALLLLALSFAHTLDDSSLYEEEVIQEANPVTSLAEPVNIRYSESLPSHQAVNFSRSLDVIAAPEQIEEEEFRKRLSTYMNQYYQDIKPQERPSIAVITAMEGMPLFEPLPYPAVDSIRYVVEPVEDSYTLYDLNCVCDVEDQQQVIQSYIDDINAHRHLFESTLIVRNALYHYYEDHNKLPGSLDQLLESFPHNYLSQVPDLTESVVHLTGRSPAAFDYLPEEMNEGAPWHSIKRIVPYPALPEPTFDMKPLAVMINRDNFWLTLSSGDHIIRSYPVALGKNKQTPVGVFTAALRVNEPLSQTKVYGTRAIALSDPDYAIHGTNDPSSIGHAVSLGCIRLYNNDMEELYSFVSLGTKISIVDEPKPKIKAKKPSQPVILDARNEEKVNKVYHWKN